MSGEQAFLALLKRERTVVAAALAAIVALAWLDLFWLAAQMHAAMAPSGLDGMDMPGMDAMAPRFVAWSPGYFLLMFGMWSVMMVGMMIPSAAPMILIYAQVARQATTLGKTFVSSGWFTAGYLIAWCAFAAAATVAQWGLERAALLSPMMVAASPVFGGIVLLAAGLYQFTPVKDACLAHCRAPLSFIQHHGGFKGDVWGALKLGARHGFYCIGCCWVLMALLFVGGVMNIFWIAGLTIFVLLEKVIPGGRYLTRVAGVFAILAGAAMLAQVKF